MQLLVVDDDRRLVGVLLQLLARHGHAGDGFETVEDALDAFAARPDGYDGALLDVHVGRGDGVDLAVKLRALRPTLLIAFVTGSEEGATRARVHGDLLLKPYTENELVAILERWFGQP